MGMEMGCRKKSIIGKNGKSSIKNENLIRKVNFHGDIYTTLVDIRWRYTILVFFVSFFICWLVFAAAYYLIVLANGPSQSNDRHNRTCITNVQSFTGAFLFSMESQHTIGYGYRYITEECPVAIIVLCLQSIISVVIQAFMVGVMFSKMTRPKKRTNKILFSKKATINPKTGKLTFRIADVGKSSIIGSSIRALVVKKNEYNEDENSCYHQQEIQIKAEGSNCSLLFLWPLTIVHKIDEKSPFYDLTATEISREQIELIVFLEGTAESTGVSVQARHSYSAEDILWGHRFVNLMSYCFETNQHCINFARFDSTIEDDCPFH